VALAAALVLGGCSQPKRCDYVVVAQGEAAARSWKLDATQKPIVVQRGLVTIVSWTLPDGADKGGTPVIEIRSADCTVVSAVHEK